MRHNVWCKTSRIELWIVNCAAAASEGFATIWNSITQLCVCFSFFLSIHNSTYDCIIFEHSDFNWPENRLGGSPSIACECNVKTHEPARTRQMQLCRYASTDIDMSLKSSSHFVKNRFIDEKVIFSVFKWIQKSTHKLVTRLSVINSKSISIISTIMRFFFGVTCDKAHTS